jgi:dTDP-4-amino-4,6-dideoxygalactose transaminase
MLDRIAPIPWASPQAQYGAHRKPIQDAIVRVLESNTYILGEEVEAFERTFANYCGVIEGIGVASGTDALILALKSLGIGAGDDVITVSHTAVATVAAVLACGAAPVLVDIDAAYYTIDPARIEDAITPKTKAIIAVHIYGQPAAMDAIVEIARRRGLFTVEDCAQAAGGRYCGRRVGGIGDVGCFSFYPTKNLGAIGDAGMVVTSNADVAARVRRLRQYGWDQARNTHEAGYNSRLDPLQAAILSVKLPHLDADNARRIAIAARYGEGLAGSFVTLPATRAADSHAYHLYVVQGDRRDDLMTHLTADQIGCSVHYPVPVHRQRGYAERAICPRDGLAVTDALAGRILSLPIYPELTDAQVDRVIMSIRRYAHLR